MRQLPALLSALALTFAATLAQAQTYSVNHFHKIIISPYIQATFVQGNEESVTINNSLTDTGNIHVESRNGTLRVYLDGAKDIPHDQKDYREDGSTYRHRIYPNHAVIATITYKKLDFLSLRGEETFLCQSPLLANNFTLRVYGDSKVIFTEVHFRKMHTTLYGDGSLDIRSGLVDNQVYTSYGDGKVNTTAIGGQAAKVTAFGEAEFRVNVSDRIKVTSFGEAKICYLGNPEIVKGLHFGELSLRKLD